jgi:hypothetical protein
MALPSSSGRRYPVYRGIPDLCSDSQVTRSATLRDPFQASKYTRDLRCQRTEDG